MICTFICALFLRHAVLLDNLYHIASGSTAHIIMQTEATFASIAQNTLNINNPTFKIDSLMCLWYYKKNSYHQHNCLFVFINNINYITICFDQNFGYLQNSISHKKHKLQLQL